MGEGPFQGIYSLVALITFGAMIYFYRAIGREPQLWNAGDAVWIAGTVLMWLGSILFVGSFVRNPALPGARLDRGGSPHGRVRDHPPSDDVGLRHLGDRPSDRRRRRPRRWCSTARSSSSRWSARSARTARKPKLMGERWHEWTAQTAFVPFTRGRRQSRHGRAHRRDLAVLRCDLGSIRLPAGFWRWIG